MKKIHPFLMGIIVVILGLVAAAVLGTGTANAAPQEPQWSYKSLTGGGGN